VRQPSLHTWTDQPTRLIEQSVAKDDPDPKALACYGLLLRPSGSDPEDLMLRFVDGRPISAITTPFLADCCDRLAARGKRALLVVWAGTLWVSSWHISNAVKAWLREHNRQVKREGRGVRIIACQLPVKAPWLNPIEPKWVHGKRAVVEPARLLTAAELEERVCQYFGATGPMTLFMIGAHRYLPLWQQSSLPPRKLTMDLARRVGLKKYMNQAQRTAATWLAHFAYGTAIGAAYAPLARKIPGPSVVKGTAFGLAVWLASYMIGIPALQMPEAAKDQPVHRNALMTGAHVVWGAVAGIVMDLFKRSSMDG